MRSYLLSGLKLKVKLRILLVFVAQAIRPNSLNSNSCHTALIVISNAMLKVITLSTIAYTIGADSPLSEPRPNLRGNVVSASVLREVEFVVDFSSINSSMFDETDNTTSLLQNTSNDSAGELESEWHHHHQHWGIPHHPIRRALVCHAVFGHHHRFLRRACWFAGFIEVSANSSIDFDNNATHLDSAALDDIENHLVATFGNETNASNVELTSEWGIPHHPIRRAMVCHAVFGPHHRFLRRACWWSGR